MHKINHWQISMTILFTIGDSWDHEPPNNLCLTRCGREKGGLVAFCEGCPSICKEKLRSGTLWQLRMEMPKHRMCLDLRARFLLFGVGRGRGDGLEGDMEHDSTGSREKWFLNCPSRSPIVDTCCHC